MCEVSYLESREQSMRKNGNGYAKMATDIEVLKSQLQGFVVQQEMLIERVESLNKNTDGLLISVSSLESADRTRFQDKQLHGPQLKNGEGRLRDNIIMAIVASAFSFVVSLFVKRW